MVAGRQAGVRQEAQAAESVHVQAEVEAVPTPAFNASYLLLSASRFPISSALPLLHGLPHLLLMRTFYAITLSFRCFDDAFLLR